MENTNYNGWTNYATWRIALEWFDGFNPSDNGYSEDISELPVQLKDYVYEVLDETCEDNLCKNYALAFISNVNWYEIAEHLIETNEV